MMKKLKLLTFALLTALISGCSVNNEPTPKIDIGEEKVLKTDRDYVVYTARAGYINIVDAKEHKYYKSCKVDGIATPGGLVVSPDGSVGYVLQNNFQTIGGYNLNTCKKVFSAELSKDNVIGRAIFSMTLSPKGDKLYTISNEVEKQIDRYKVHEPKLKVYDVNGGIDATPEAVYKAPRQISVMSTDNAGNIYAAGADVYKFDPKTGKMSVAAKHRNWEKKNYSAPDSLAMWPIGKTSNEFLLMYTAAKFPNDKFDMNEAEFIWGATRINLETGEVEQDDFAPFETIMFTGMTHPKDPNLLYGVLTDLSKFDRENKKLIKRVYLDHTYYCLGFATDGSELYIAGLNHILIVDPETLESKKRLELPFGDIGAGTMQVIRAK